METKASYIAVGAAALLAVAMFFGMLLFAVNKGDGRQVTYYEIVFEGGVSGLSIGNDVRFNGINVGEVRQIDIDLNDPSRVLVIIYVHGEVPVREDSKARLEAQGITGLSIVYISGGNAQSPKLMPKNGAAMARIQSVRSPISLVMDNASSLVGTANELLRRGVSILSPENEAYLNDTLESLAIMSKTLEGKSLELKEAMQNLTGASDHMANVVNNAEQLIGTDLPEAVKTFQATFKRLDNILLKAEPGIDRLTSGTVDELQRTLNEAAMLLRNMNIMVQKINSDPQRFFYGDNVPDYNMR